MTFGGFSEIDEHKMHFINYRKRLPNMIIFVTGELVVNYGLTDEAVIVYFYLITLCTHRFPTINLEISSLNSLFAIVTIHLTFSMPCN